MLYLNIIHTVYPANDLFSLVTTLSQLLLKLRLLSCHRLSPISQAIWSDDFCSVIRVTLESPTPVSSALIGFDIVLCVSFSSSRFDTQKNVYRSYVRTLNLYFRCFAGFSGANCSIASCLSVNNCSGHGLCVEAGLCKCDVGYTGSDCANASCEAVNYCSG